jgi:hypothetical protein
MLVMAPLQAPQSRGPCSRDARASRLKLAVCSDQAVLKTGSLRLAGPRVRASGHLSQMWGARVGLGDDAEQVAACGTAVRIRDARR